MGGDTGGCAEGVSSCQWGFETSVLRLAPEKECTSVSRGQATALPRADCGSRATKDLGATSFEDVVLHSSPFEPNAKRVTSAEVPDFQTAAAEDDLYLRAGSCSVFRLPDHSTKCGLTEHQYPPSKSGRPKHLARFADVSEEDPRQHRRRQGWPFQSKIQTRNDHIQSQGRPCRHAHDRPRRCDVKLDGLALVSGEQAVERGLLPYGHRNSGPNGHLRAARAWPKPHRTLAAKRTSDKLLLILWPGLIFARRASWHRPLRPILAHTERNLALATRCRTRNQRLRHVSGGVRSVVGVTSAVGLEVAVAGPFVACVRVDGEEVRGCLSELGLEVLRGARPVRSPGVYRRQRHMPGQWFSSTVYGNGLVAGVDTTSPSAVLFGHPLSKGLAAFRAILRGRRGWRIDSCNHRVFTALAPGGPGTGIEWNAGKLGYVKIDVGGVLDDCAAL